MEERMNDVIMLVDLDIHDFAVAYDIVCTDSTIIDANTVIGFVSCVVENAFLGEFGLHHFQVLFI
jgi:hypothetical protein